MTNLGRDTGKFTKVSVQVKKGDDYRVGMLYSLTGWVKLAGDEWHRKRELNVVTTDFSRKK